MFDLILHSSLFAQLTYDLSFRHILASLHFNENVKRETKTDKDGKPYYQLSYPSSNLGKRWYKKWQFLPHMVGCATVQVHYLLDYLCGVI